MELLGNCMVRKLEECVVIRDTWFAFHGEEWYRYVFLERETLFVLTKDWGKTIWLWCVVFIIR